MDHRRATDGDIAQGKELEFFGVRLKVKDPRLAELLNSGATEDVQVIGTRARDGSVSAGDDAGAESEVEQRALHPDGSVRARPREVEDS